MQEEKREEIDGGIVRERTRRRGKVRGNKTKGTVLSE